MGTIHRLNSLGVNNAVKPGYYGDGGGLYLQISQFGTKSWVFRFTLNKKREMGLGPIHDISLKKAREIAQECRLLLREGIDPITYRKERRAQAQNKSAAFMTFKDCAEKYVRNNQAGWANPKHAKQWASTLEMYVYPKIGPLPVSAIETTHILEILEPIWSEKNQTAKRVRGRIEIVLDAARVAKLRTGENPARWKGHLDKLLPAASRVAKVIHHPSLPYAETGNFIAVLRAQDGIAPLALEFLILTAARTNEVIEATFDEFDLDKGVWIIPAIDIEKVQKEFNRLLKIVDEAKETDDTNKIQVAAKQSLLFISKLSGNEIAKWLMQEAQQPLAKMPYIKSDKPARIGSSSYVKRGLARLTLAMPDVLDAAHMSPEVLARDLIEMSYENGSKPILLSVAEKGRGKKDKRDLKLAAKKRIARVVYHEAARKNQEIKITFHQLNRTSDDARLSVCSQQIVLG